MLNSKTGTVKSSQFTTNSNHPDTEKEDKQSDIVEVKEMTSKELSVNVKDKKPSTKETDDNSKTQPADVRVPEPEPTKVPETDKVE
ncbi:hypothetical protein J6590_056477 [Homalodisca vitripennis]|nr:hypothetical protein J6590_056477 [Homalodisca vitripennis]